MAERGGYRRPSEPASYSGVGRNSRRTDGGSQAVRSPNVQDSTELTQGDRQRIEQGQRVAPLSRTPAPQVQTPAPGAPTGAGGGSAQLPPHLFGGDSSRPDEPLTEGLPFGPGAGPDVLTQAPPQDNRELMLNFLATTLGNEDAANMLNDYRNERTQPDEPMLAAPQPGPMDAPIEDEATGMEDDLDLPDDEDLADEDLDEDLDDLDIEEEVAVEGDEEAQTSVETPEAAASAPPAGEGE